MFIYQIDKKEEENNIKLRYFYFDEKKDSKILTNKINYLIYIKKKDFESLNLKSENIKISKDNYLNKNKEIILKIEIKSKELFDYILKTSKENNVELYELDFPEEHLELLENIKISKEIPKTLPKILSIDIETIGSKEEQRIVLISSYSEEKNFQNKVFVNLEEFSKENITKIKNKKFKDFKIIFCENESLILNKFKEDVQEFSPQLIIGWNCIDFDFYVIKERMKIYNIDFNFSKIDGKANLRLAKSFFGKSTLTFPGIIVIDGISLLKTNFINFEDFKLDTVAREVLGDSKINIEFSESFDSSSSINNKIKAIENLLKNDPIKLIEYNFKDSLLVHLILKKLNLIKLMMIRSTITNTPFLKIQSPIATLDIMYLSKLHKRGFVAPSNFNFNSSTPIEGAFVLEPKPGYYKNVFVLDFTSLYPSIIMTFNIDPFTISKNGQIEAPNGAKFDKKKGILPELISKLYNMRAEAKKNNEKIMASALKVTMNSFYGAMASPKSRFHNKDVAGAITSFGRKIILETNSFIESIGLKVIYNDTDSTFITTDKEFKNLDEKIRFGKDIENKINKHFESWTLKNNAIENSIKIEFEKLYNNFFISTKKRYVGYNELKEKLEFVGLEAIRGDWTSFAREFQIELVKRIFNGDNKEEIKKFILNHIDKLKKGEFDRDLIYRKKITKPLSEYTKTTPPHVKAARELKDFNGKIVEYAITKEGPKHKLLLGENPKFDYEHYIEKQLGGVSEDLLKFLGMDFKEIVNSKKQKSLNEFW